MASFETSNIGYTAVARSISHFRIRILVQSYSLMLLFFHGKNRSKVSVPFIKWSSRIPAIISWFDILKQPLNPRNTLEVWECTVNMTLMGMSGIWISCFEVRTTFFQTCIGARNTLRRSKDHNKLLLVSPNLQYCENMNRKSFCSRISSSLREVSTFKIQTAFSSDFGLGHFLAFSFFCHLQSSTELPDETIVYSECDV